MKRVLLMLVIATAAAAQEDPFAALHAQLEAAAEASVVRASTPPSPVIEEPAQLTAPVEVAGGTALERVRALTPHLQAILIEEGVPENLAAVVLVESGGVATALSPKGARGLWQFMPETARRYGLQVGEQVDERLHMEKATRAAARYLRDLYRQFHDWELALASYNAGEGAVARALTRARATSFAEASRFLPDETRKYVPAVLKAMPLFGRTQRARIQAVSRF